VYARRCAPRARYFQIRNSSAYLTIHHDSFPFPLLSILNSWTCLTDIGTKGVDANSQFCHGLRNFTVAIITLLTRKYFDTHFGGRRACRLASPVTYAIIPQHFPGVPDVGHIPCNVRKFKDEIFTMWRCTGCGCAEHVDLRLYYADYSLKEQKLTFRERIGYTNRMQLLDGTERNVRTESWITAVVQAFCGFSADKWFSECFRLRCICAGIRRLPRIRNLF